MASEGVRLRVPSREGCELGDHIVKGEVLGRRLAICILELDACGVFTGARDRFDSCDPATGASRA